MRFNEQVWDLMKKVPEGQVTTYKLLAERLGSKAYRAVGNACCRNPYAPIVPCHRVVQSDGSIGGFDGHTSGPSITKKIELLEKEGIPIRNGKIVNLQRFLYKF